MASALHGTHCSEATVEIKIKTLDSQTYNLRVDKCVPVPELKQQIATVTGVLSEQQRLICRGRVLKDDQLLSAYHVEDGHTLHLVVRQPIPASSDSLPFDPANDASRSQGSQTGPSVFLGAFNTSEHGDGGFPSLNQIISAALSSIGVGNSSEGVNFRELSNRGLGDSNGQQLNQSTLLPPVVPDSLTTLSQYLVHLRHEFGSNGVNGNSSPNSVDYGSNVQNSETIPHSTSGQNGLPRPAFLAEVLLSTRQLLIEQVADCLSHLARQLEDQVNTIDQSMRTSVQTYSLRSGALLQNLGALLLELGRSTMMLRVGQTPADAVVNAGPPVFISTSGPNPIMVQPFPFRTGTSFGTNLTGTAEVPRNINVRIRTGTFMSSINGNERESNSPQPSTGEINLGASGGANSVHQANAATPVNAPSIRVSEVRVVPIRTVIAAVPPPARQTNSDSPPSSTGLFYPVLSRMQRADSEALDSMTDSRIPSDESPGMPFNIGDHVNFQSRATNSTPHEAVVNTQEATQAVGNEGTFLSTVLRQIMPLITQNASSGPEVAPPERDAGNRQTSTQASNSNVGSSSRARSDDPSSNCPSKRQKME